MMFNKKLEDKKYTSVYNSQANQSTSIKVPLNSSFNNRPFTSKVPPSNTSVLKNNFLNNGAASTNLRSSMSKTTAGSSASKSATTNSITKNRFLSSDDKYSYSSNSSTSINRTNLITTHTERSYEIKSGTTAFSPTFGPTSLFNSKYDKGLSIEPSFRTPITTSSLAATSYANRAIPVVTKPIYNRPVATQIISTRPEMKHLPLKSFMKTNNKGFCVIFNHAKFKNPELNRAGTEHDEKSLLKVFKKFNIKCEVKSDFTLTKIKREIKDLTKKDFSKYACLIIVILSHGSTHEQLSSFDESYFLDPVITEPIFKNKTLADKPKFFFIQACKGSSNSLVHTNIPLADSHSVDKRQILAEANLMKCYSTYESRVAYRFSDTGSIFIKTFCEILEEDGDKKHIQDIMQAVGKKITSTKELALQVPSVLSTMTANFYFCNLSFEE